MSVKSFLSTTALVGICLVAGWYGGPLVRSAQAYLFPQPAYVVGDYQYLYRQSNHDVVLFSTSTCPFCELTRQLLARNRIRYIDYVIDRSERSKQLFDAVGAGKVPQIFVGERRITGFHEEAIIEALRVNGYPVDAAKGGAANASDLDRVGGET